MTNEPFDIEKEIEQLENTLVKFLEEVAEWPGYWRKP